MPAVTLKIPKDKPSNPLAAGVKFTIPVRPTTKKTSNRIVTFKKKFFNPKTRQAGVKLMHAVLPSEDYVEFERQCVSHAATIARSLQGQGVRLPISNLISVRALIYREKRVGDHTGFTQAIGDALQAMDVITNDRIIEHWDGTRRLHDPKFPRLEIFIQPAGESAQEELL